MQRRRDVHRKTVELDMHALRRARDVLGTTTIRETIDRALHEVDRFAALRRAADTIRTGGLRELNVVRADDLPALRKVER